MDSVNFYAELTPSINQSESDVGHKDSPENVVKILVLTVSILGLVTNSMIVIVLSQLRGSHPIGGGEKSARCNLLGLAVADFCICLSTMPLVYSKRQYTKNEIMLYYTLYGPGLASTFITVSAWMVVLVSILRYLAICWPLKSRFYLRSRSVIIVIITIYPAALIFNFPYFLQYDYEVLSNNDTEYIHIFDRIYPHAEVFKDIYNVIHIICTNAGPFIAVLVTNISVIVACKKSQVICEKTKSHLKSEKHAKYSRPLTTTSISTNNVGHAATSNLNHMFNTSLSIPASRHQIASRCHSLQPRALHRVTPLLLAVIFAFLLLSTPSGIVQFICLKLIDNIGPQIYENELLRQRYYFLNRLLQWSNFLQVFGCAVNFFLYFMVSRTFRRTTKRTIRRIFQRFRRRRGLSHLCAYICSVSCCGERRSCSNEAYIVRVYSPIECRNLQRHRRLTKPLPLCREKNLLSPNLEPHYRKPSRNIHERQDEANLKPAISGEIELRTKTV